MGIFILLLAVQAQARMTLPSVARTSPKTDISFDETTERYPSPDATLNQIRRLAPFAKYLACSTIDEGSSPVIGAIDPLQSAPLELTPGPFYFEYYRKCATNQIEFGLGYYSDEAVRANSELILGTDLPTRVAAAVPAAYKPAASDLRLLWNSLPIEAIPDELMQEIVDHFVLFLVGPEEILLHYRYIGENNVFQRPMNSAAEFRNFLIEELVKTIHLDAPTEKHQLRSVYTEMAILLRLGPALKK